MLTKRYYVYIMAHKPRGVIYTGITGDLVRRVYEHKNNLMNGFTKNYKTHLLVYFEASNSAESAIAREKAIKKWNRAWKIALIEKVNPEWKDLYSTICRV